MDNLAVNMSGASKRTRGRGRGGFDHVTKKFLHNFDPEQSEREKRKLNRRLNHGNKKMALYDERGNNLQTGEDFCDCLQKSCMGCHFPCPKCYSPKCGHECRNNRKWMYDSIENEGSDNVVRNHCMNNILRSEPDSSTSHSSLFSEYKEMTVSPQVAKDDLLGKYKHYKPSREEFGIKSENGAKLNNHFNLS